MTTTEKCCAGLALCLAWLLLAFLAIGLQGCGPNLCDEHRQLAVASGPVEREGLQKELDGIAIREVSLARIMKGIPRSDCPECDKLIARVLALQSL